MDHFEEIESKIYTEAAIKLDDAKRKRLYTWHDIEAEREKYEEKYNALPEAGSNYKWVLFSGIGIGFILAVIILHFLN